MAGMRTRRVYLEDLGVGHGAEEQARAEGEPLAKDHGVVVTPAKGVVKSAAWLFFFLDVDALFPRDKISPSRYQGQARSQTEAPKENRRPGEARVVKWWWWKWSRARDMKRSGWPGAQKPKGNKQRMSLLYQSSRGTISEKRAEVWDKGGSEKEKRHPLGHAAAFTCKASQNKSTQSNKGLPRKRRSRGHGAGKWASRHSQSQGCGRHPAKCPM